jgi:predicted acyl esterase
VHVFDRGAGRWRSMADLPEPMGETLWLVSSGLAAVLPDDGEITGDVPDGVSVDRLVLAPGAAGEGAGDGPADGAVDGAADGGTRPLLYRTEPFDEDILIAGPARLELSAAADAAGADLLARLDVVGPEGDVRPLASGRVAIGGAGEGAARIEFATVIDTVARGSRLAIVLSLVASPGPPDRAAASREPVTVELFCGGEEGTRLLL